MLSLIRSLLARFKRPVFVIEVKAPLPVLDKSANESIKTLAHHNGFVELTNRLKIQRAFLETKLKRDPSVDLVSLQQAIYWSEYWEREVETAVNKRPAPKYVEADFDVMAEFQKINGAITGVSQKAPQ